METINLLSTKRPVSKVALEEAIKGTKGAIWHQSINKVRGNEYPFHQIFIPIKIKGVKEPIRIRTDWIEVAPNHLMHYFMEIDYASVQIGETRYEALKEAFLTFIQPEWFVPVDPKASVFVETKHQTREWYEFKQDYNPYHYSLDHIANHFLVIHHLSSKVVNPLFEWHYHPMYRHNNSTHHHYFVSWNGMIFNQFNPYSDATYLYEWNGTYPTYQTTYGERISNYGTFIHEIETDKVYEYERNWDESTSARFFPKELNDLRRDSFFKRDAFLWTELARAYQLPLDQQEVGDLEKDGFHLKFYSPKLFEENQTTFNVGDYVRFREEAFGRVISDELAEQGVYRILFEVNQADETQGKDCHISQLTLVTEPKQYHVNRLVISREGFVGKLETEGYGYSRIQMLVYTRNETNQREYTWKSKVVPNHEFLLIDSEEWEKSFKMLQFETDWRVYFADLANDSAWSFLNQWLTYCHMFNFSDQWSSDGCQEITFFYALTTLTRSVKNFLVVQELILRASFNQEEHYGYTNAKNLGRPSQKAKAFIDLVLSHPSFKFAFSNLPSQQVEN